MRVERAAFNAWRGPFVGSLVAIIALLVLGHMRKLAAAALGLGLTAGDALHVIAALVPPLLVFALPIAHLCAVVMSLGRWHDDGELDAWWAAGVSPLRLSAAAVACGVGLTAIGLPVAHWAQPAGWNQLQAALTKVALKNASAHLSTAGETRTLGGLWLSARTGSIASDLRDLVLHLPGRGWVTAAAGRFIVDGDRLDLVVSRGEAHPDEPGDTYGRARFEQATIPLDVGALLSDKTRMVSADGRLSTAEMRAEARALEVGSPRRRRLEKMAARRTALPALALVFGWVAVPIAIGTRRWRWPAAVAVVVGFYALLRLGDALVAQRPSAVSWIVWGPHMVLVIVGAVGLRWWSRPR